MTTIIEEYEEPILIRDIEDIISDNRFVHKPYLENSLVEKIIEDKINIAIDIINHFFICKGEINLFKREDYEVTFSIKDHDSEDLSYTDKASYVTIHNKPGKRAIQIRSTSSDLPITIIMFNNFKLDSSREISSSSSGVLGSTVTITELCNFHLLGKLFDFLRDGNIDLSTKPSLVTFH